MEAVTVVLLLALLAMGGAALWLLAQRRRPEAESEAQRLEQQLVATRAELAQALAGTQQSLGDAQRTLLQQMSNVDAKLNQRLDAVQGDIGRSMASQHETMGRIGEQLGGLGETAKRFLEVGQGVNSLKDLLQPPKLRGAFGELLLDQLLRQVLPAAQYRTQHRYKDGTVVDVVICTPDGMVPVDSKFPIESYRRLFDAASEEDRARLRKAFMRDVRARVEEVAKYIRPDEGTLDFACMYVPAEGIFYEIIAGGAEEDSMTFALERQVHLVSPNTFYALLQVVARGLARLQVQQDVKEFMAKLAQVRREFARFRQEFDRLGTHLGHARNKYDELDKWVDKIDNRLIMATDEPVQVELPDLADAAEPLPGPREIPARTTLPRPATINGSDDAP